MSTQQAAPLPAWHVYWLLELWISAWAQTKAVRSVDRPRTTQCWASNQNRGSYLKAAAYPSKLLSNPTGPISRSVQDCSTMLEIIAGCDTGYAEEHLPAFKIDKDVGRVLGLLGMLRRTIGGTQNAAAFNNAEYPGLSLPVGFVSASEDGEIWLPTGLHIVERKFEDFTCLEIAASWNG